MNNQEQSYSAQFVTPIRSAMFSHRELMLEAERQFGPFEEGGYHPGQRISASTLSSLLMFLYQKTGFRDLALKSGALVELNQFGAINYYLMACTSLPDLFESLVTVNELLISPQERMWLEHDHGDLVLAITPTRIMGLPDMLRYEQLLSTLTNLVSFLAGNDCRPVRIEMPTPKPEEHALHSTWFGCDISYQQPYFKLIYSADWEVVTLPNANASMKEVLRPEISRYLQEVRVNDTLVQKVFDILDNQPNLMGINQTVIASRLNMSESTLKRRLGEEDASFKTLFTIYRQRRTLELLTKEKDLDQIALALGFSERASFERAFKNWYQITPARFRNLVRLCDVHQTKIDLGQVDELPGAPGVCREIIQILNQEEYELEDLLSVLQNDPVLSAKLLGLANSAFFGSQKVTNLEQAIVRVLGTQTVLNLAIALLACGELVSKDQDSLNMAEFWSQSLVSAWWAGELSAALPSEELSQNSNQLYLTALLASLGLLLLVKLRPDDLNDLIPILDQAESAGEVAEFERRVLDITRFEASSVLLTHWGLPSFLIANINELLRRLDQTSDLTLDMRIVALSLDMAFMDLNSTEDHWKELLQQHLGEELEQNKIERLAIKAADKLPVLQEMTQQLFV